MSLSITAQQLTEAAIKPADYGSGSVAVLHGINVRVAVAVKIAGDDSLPRCDLGGVRQRFEAETPVRLAQEYSAPKFRGSVALRGCEFFLAQNFNQGGPCIGVIGGQAFQHRGNCRAESPPRPPRIESVAFIVGLN